ncbi:MAG: MarR family transcriptional regulator [Myxococcota bacterium]
MNSSGPQRSPGFHLWHAALRWRSAVQDALGDRLTATQFFVLGAIAWLGKTSGAPTQAQVADFSATDPMTTSQVVRALEKRGLLVRTDDPHDSRSWRLGVTPTGRALVKECAALVREVDRAFFAGLDANTLTRLEKLHER